MQSLKRNGIKENVIFIVIALIPHITKMYDIIKMERRDPGETNFVRGTKHYGYRKNQGIKKCDGRDIGV